MADAGSLELRREKPPRHPSVRGVFAEAVVTAPVFEAVATLCAPPKRPMPERVRSCRTQQFIQEARR